MNMQTEQSSQLGGIRLGGGGTGIFSNLSSMLVSTNKTN